MSSARLVHPVLQTVRGMCADEDPYPTIDATVAAAVDLAKDLEDENRRLTVAIEEYSLWEPGRAGHAAAHRKLMEALR